jgi:hypothetical protein
MHEDPDSGQVIRVEVLLIEPGAAKSFLARHDYADWAMSPLKTGGGIATRLTKLQGWPSSVLELAVASVN